MRAILFAVVLFLIHQQQIHAQRRLPCNCNAADVSPMCGTDNRDYWNMCALNCAAGFGEEFVEVAYKGYCDRRRTNICACPRNYDPVCANNGKTFSNMCMLFCQQNDFPDLSVLDFGECKNSYRNIRQSGQYQPRPCTCAKESNPVCGSNGKTYANLCMLQCADKESFRPIFMMYDGYCKNK